MDDFKRAGRRKGAQKCRYRCCTLPRMVKGSARAAVKRETKRQARDEGEAEG